ncbi:predicted protein [Phaeodactylum tricornutum CCAP 1055/1]|uniref:Uncharacterized protein n=1 Tax=Phaeodactylum tricornutum (strain CCAP 1055/1) TaxID=556484 RepID=B7G346_PHATC|nr:predicted protein [Phaeodactylum tricornutum CCAP 1055/1]EEC46767.1 predicted protein [Phaeodactylum tricornutum CCAP 1055/1]|eukprot:XP_002181553.1 predicted protein [Phaeodactylum tricornutum CCAP 1055/1]
MMRTTEADLARLDEKNDYPIFGSPITLRALWETLVSYRNPNALYTLVVAHIAWSSAVERREPMDFIDFDSLRLPNRPLSGPGGRTTFALDVWIGRSMVSQSRQREDSITFHILVVVPCLILTCLLVPTGFLLCHVLMNASGKTTQAPDLVQGEPFSPNSNVNRA